MSDLVKLAQSVMEAHPEYRERLEPHVRAAAGVPSISKWVDELVVDDYPYGQFTTQARWYIEKSGRGQRVCRVTVNPKTGRPNKPNCTTYNVAWKIGVGSDGRTYLLGGRPGQLGFMAGDMKYSVGGGIFTGNPDYEHLAKVLGFKSGPGRIQTKSYPGGATIDGLQGQETTIRKIMELGGLSPEDMEQIDKMHRKRTITHDEWTVTFKDGRPKYIIKVIA